MSCHRAPRFVLRRRSFVGCFRPSPLFCTYVCSRWFVAYAYSLAVYFCPSVALYAVVMTGRVRRPSSPAPCRGVSCLYLFLF